MTATILVVVLQCFSIKSTTAFVSTSRKLSNSMPARTSFAMGMRRFQRSDIHLFLSDNNSNQSNEDRIRQLGFTNDEIRQSMKKSDPEEIKVRVDIVDEVDPVSLTAVGFALIALNFLVFANLGDGGISGVVARMINTF
jgi:hypothetical protein